MLPQELTVVGMSSQVQSTAVVDANRMRASRASYALFSPGPQLACAEGEPDAACLGKMDTYFRQAVEVLAMAAVTASGYT